jgi:thiol:disulfide interchange protein DsbD
MTTWKFTSIIARLLSFASLIFLSFVFHSNAADAPHKLTLLPSELLNSNASASGPHIQVSLLSENDVLVPGQTHYIGILLQPEYQWHTYWQNPGDSGEAPAIEWQAEEVNSNADLTASFVFNDIEWPIPQAIPVAHLVNYGYEGENLLMVALDVPSTLVAGSQVSISADLSWLVCKEDCIPGWATLSISLPVAQTANQSAKLSAQADLFTQTRALHPSPEIAGGMHEITQAHVVVELYDLPKTAGMGQWYLFPTQNYVIDHAAEQQWLLADDSADSSNINQGSQIQRVIIPRSLYFDGEASSLQWLVSNGEEAFYLETTLSELDGSSAIGAAQAETGLIALLQYLGMAFLGGLILNLMPCVLPILSIKAVALQQVESSLKHKLAYLVGVLVCFNLFALLVLGLKQSGQQIGWGFHMQEPIVVVLLAFLFAFIALILFDVMQFATRLSGFGQSWVSGNSAQSHFATGALAVIVASPCTAPFMAAALGIAFVSEAYVTLLIFNALAIGFAIPITLLFISPAMQSYLPKPGAWMESFKRFLGFPMLATVAWLVWVFAGQVGVQMQFLLLICIIMFCMFVWLLGQTSKPVFKFMLYLGVVMSVSVPIYLSIGHEGAAVKQQSATSISIPYDPQTLASLKADQQIVVVNMTADWCITCKVNEQVALSSSTVTQALGQEGVHYMVGDWTNKNQQILEFLGQYQRAGVPLYVVYAGEDYEQVLPQILSPSMVVDAINLAKQEIEK